MKQFLILLFITLISTSALFAQEPPKLTNQEIIKLHNAGLSKEVLMLKIQKSACAFDLSLDGLLELKKVKLPDEVISAMLEKSSPTTTEKSTVVSKDATLRPGIFYFDSTRNEYVEMDPSVLTNEKSGGFGKVLRMTVSGMFTEKMKASLSGTKANTFFSTRTPSFTFVFDAKMNNFSNGNTVWSSVQSPNEFFLAKFKVEKKTREIVIGKENNVNSNIGIDDDAKIRFTYKKTGTGTFVVTVAEPLKPGEYCFMFSAASMNSGTSHKVYDFGVR